MAAEAGAGRVAADGEAGLGAVVVRGRLPGERHLQQDGTGKIWCGWNHFEGRGSVMSNGKRTDADCGIIMH